MNAATAMVSDRRPFPVCLSHQEILRWLREEDPARLQELFQMADEVRRRHVGEEVHLRGLVEISNHCLRACAYCGLRAPNRSLERYRMTEDEILDCVRQAAEYGYGTVVLQAGEDYGIECAWLAELVRRIKQETELAVTLSLGERPLRELAAWREAGADRYLLRFETSDPVLYARIHPPLGGRIVDRIALLRELRDMGYEIGSGVMIGIPGQSYASLARDIELFRELDLDMIGVGPYIPHPSTPLGARSSGAQGAPDADVAAAFPAGLREEDQVPLRHDTADQVPPDELMVYKVLALARLACPEANIPSTTALATINRETGRELGLARGANVVMPNLTPPEFRVRYEIYPGKACINETASVCHFCLAGRIETMGRRVGRGPGGRRRREREETAVTRI